MPGWTIVTLRAKDAGDYDHTDETGKTGEPATNDLAATLANDDRVAEWAVNCGTGHAYALLDCGHNDFEFAQAFLEDYRAMAADAVVLGANNTSDTGTARYYPVLGQLHVDEYAEDQDVDGVTRGAVALSTMTARYGILAQDPFRAREATADEWAREYGTDRGAN